VKTRESFILKQLLSARYKGDIRVKDKVRFGISGYIRKWSRISTYVIMLNSLLSYDARLVSPATRRSVSNGNKTFRPHGPPC
jgi:hypothetical protein